MLILRPIHCVSKVVASLDWRPPRSAVLSQCWEDMSLLSFHQGQKASPLTLRYWSLWSREKTAVRINVHQMEAKVNKSTSKELLARLKTLEWSRSKLVTQVREPFISLIGCCVGKAKAWRSCSALDSRARRPGQCVVFLGKTLYSHNASIHPGV